MKVAGNKIWVEFADYGQDSLWWVIDDGVIVEAGPCDRYKQHCIQIVGRRVLNETLTTEGRVRTVEKPGARPALLRYPIKAVELVQ